MNTRTTPATIASVIYITFAAFFTFIIPMDLDKYIGGGVAALTILSFLLKITSAKFRLRKSKVDLSISICIISLIAVYIIQFFLYGIAINIETLTLLSIVGTIHFINKHKEKLNTDLILGYFAILYLILSIATIKRHPGSYVIETNAGGILSAFILLVVLMASVKTNILGAKFVSIASACLIVYMGIRGVILSAFLVFISMFKKKYLIIGLIIALGMLLTIYIALPNSRIFEQHTSGRLFHWAAILSNFEWRNFFWGMGAHSSTQYLLDMGLQETMAAPHNEYIRYIYDLGVLGAISITTIFISLYKNSPRSNRWLILALALQMVTDNIFTYYFNYLVFFLYICLINTPTRLVRNN
jgi:hypothetical protein